MPAPKKGPVTKADLKHFDREATDLILWAQEQGARVRISRRGHAILLGPDGVSTAAVSSKSKGANRAAQNNRAGVERLFKPNADE